MYFDFIQKKDIRYNIFLKKNIFKISQINMACKWLTVFLSDLISYKQTVLCVESEVIHVGNDDSAIKSILNLSSS